MTSASADTMMVGGEKTAKTAETAKKKAEKPYELRRMDDIWRCAGLRVMALCLVITGALACTSPAPTVEQTAAEKALMAAKAVDAERYAVDEFGAATDALDAAAARMREHKYFEARAAYLLARHLAEEATSVAITNRAALREQVEQDPRSR